MAHIVNMKNRDRLVACLKREAQRYGNKHFNIKSMVFNPYLPSKYKVNIAFEFPSELHQCGSTACALGTWNTYHPEEFLNMGDDGKDGRYGFTYQCVSKWLGISFNDACDLFGYGGDEATRRCYGVSNPTIFDVIKALEALWTR